MGKWKLKEKEIAEETEGRHSDDVKILQEWKRKIVSRQMSKVLHGR